MPAQTKAVTASEVARHKTKDDCWLIINEKAYDVSTFVDRHPGGRILMTHAGLDATDTFSAFHPPSAHTLLSKFYVGEVVDHKVPEIIVEHRRILKELQEKGLFKANPWYYIYKVFTNLVLLAISISIIRLAPGLIAPLLGGFMMALFWQQCGWLSHDFLHHQVFKQRKLNNYMGVLLGNLFQGFSVAWWKDKHNHHHAMPNVSSNDPDIDTLPFIAWSEKQIDWEQAKSNPAKLLLRNQAWLYLPLLMIGRLSWCTQSILFLSQPIKNWTLEAVALGLHYLCYALIIYSYFTPLQGLLFVIASQCSNGLLLGTIFTLNHNAMQIFLDNELKPPGQATTEVDYATLVMYTTRDVNPSLVMDWLTGGLNMQVTHHLFPSLPRHNLGYVRGKYLIPFCKKFNLPYHQTSFWTGFVETVKQLSVVSSIVRQRT